MDLTFNIVELIENNPITRLTGTYQNKLITKIKEKFTENQQQIFVASFYSFLNYDSENDFVIDLDNIWKWLGFSTKQKAKFLLEKQFLINKDYTILLTPQVKQTNDMKGGHNREIFMLNTETFKKFCLKAGTKKADEIHDYFIKLEKVLQEVIHEESNELKLQLEEKNVELELKDLELKKSEKMKEKLREKTLIEQFPKNTQCVYYGVIENLSDSNEKLIKFGNSNNLKNRVVQHKDTYLNFCLINAFKVDNKLQIENEIKEHMFFNERQRTITIKNKKYIELINSEGLTFTELDKIIKEIIKSIECTPENYMKIISENKLLKKQLWEKHEKDKTHEFILLESENKRLKIENIRLKKYIKIDITNDTTEINEDEIEKYDTTINVMKTFKKNVDGTHIIGGKIYDRLIGSREDVWNEKCYKTSGGLTKDDLIIHKSGKIISKNKSVQEKSDNKFLKFGLNKVEDY